MAFRGSLDAESVGALPSQFDQLSPAEFENIIVDVSQLTAIDIAGVTALSALGELVAGVGAEVQFRHRVGASSEKYRPTAHWAPPRPSTKH